MAKILDDLSRTFSEYLLIPRLTRKEHVPRNVSLAAPIARFKTGEASRLSLNIPVVSASMQAVSGTDMGVALARQGGMAFVFCSQSIESQAAMIAKIKSHKAGFVRSDSNVKPSATLRELLDVMRKTGHSTVPVTEDGSSNGRFMGIITDKDFWEFEDDLTSQVQNYMTPKEKVIHGKVGITLKEANHSLYKNKKEALPILEADGRLNSLVFKKDYVDHINNPLELLDTRKRLVAAAGINTHDYKERLPALVDAGVDVVSFDSSDGFSEFQRDAALWARENYGDAIIIGGGNVVSAEGFRYLVEAGAAGLRQGRHRRRFHLHHPGAEGHRPRPGFGPDGSGGGAQQVLQGDGRLRADLLRRRARQRHPDHHRPGHGRRLRDDGPLLRHDRRKPHPQGFHQGPASTSPTGARAPTAPATGSATWMKRDPRACTSRKAWTATCPW